VVASAAAAGEAGGVDHAVVGQRGGWIAVLGGGLGEGGDHDRCGDAGVRREVQGVAGVVVEPGDDLGVGAGGQPVVGEVRLPGLIGHLGLKAQVGGFGSLARRRGHLSGAGQDPVDGGPRQGDAVMVGQVPADGVRAGVQAGFGE
jgi:hypothetical protein